ncbi:hypothetical protein COO60DRAFT_1506906 [Scenedesmus sp. NREL 46B-D3]|nr:hypothetical protein COO60DRAFT_1506906 [Scenedesmus sp. NREL 46B-D3]
MCPGRWLCTLKLAQQLLISRSGALSPTSLVSTTTANACPGSPNCTCIGQLRPWRVVAVVLSALTRCPAGPHCGKEMRKGLLTSGHAAP